LACRRHFRPVGACPAAEPGRGSHLAEGVPAQASLAIAVPLTLVTIGYSALTVKADFNKTHATNPLWTGHARFHVVWQMTSYVGFALIALFLIWLPGPHAHEHLYLACAFAAVSYGAFFITLFSMALYGGRAYDDNGYLPFAVAGMKWNASVTAFSVLTVFLLVSVALVLVG
jgi:hypothetical protein